MKATVILCTFNRCQSLAKALDSLAATILPALRSGKFLVVDNNSGDSTREVVEDFCRRYPDRFRYCFRTAAGQVVRLELWDRGGSGGRARFRG